MTDFNPNATLAEVQVWLRDHMDDGTTCPACTQHVQVYRRKINSGMARALIAQYQGAGMDVVHTRRLWLPWSKEAAQLQWWGLIEPHEGPSDGVSGGRTSGMWRVTPTGRAFIRRETKAPKYARVYDGRLLSFDHSTYVDITDCLGTKFDYDELMVGV